MSKHTPGPWRLQPHYKGGWKGIAKDPTPNRWQAIYVPGQERGAKGIVVGIGIKGGEVDDYWLSITEADARLIEAAPELLEALKQIAADTHGTVDDPDASRINRIARAAIAKAERAEP